MKFIPYVVPIGLLMLSAATLLSKDLPQRGVLVEQVEKGSAGETSGLRPGDLLVSWSRDRETGQIDSPFTLLDTEIEQGRRGPVRLEGRRGLTTQTWTLAPRTWGLTSQPILPPELHQIYEEGRERFRAGQFSEAADLWQKASMRLSNTSELRTWFVSIEAQAQAKASNWTNCDAAYATALQQAALLRPLVRIELLETWAGTFSQRNDLAQADSYYQRALVESQKSGAEKTMLVAFLLNYLGATADARGKTPQAEIYYRRALEIREKLAPGSGAVAASLNNLGNLALERGQLKQAASYYQRALTIREKLDPGGLDTAASLNNLGVVIHKTGQLAEAEVYCRRAVAIRENLAPDSLDVAMSLNNLGNILRDRGDLSRAELCYGKSLALREKLVPGSLDVAATLNNLGALAASRGELLQAEQNYRQALVIWERLSPGSLNVATGLSNLAVVIQKRGNLAQAETYCRTALEIRAKLAPGSLDLAETLGNLGLINRARGDLVQAGVYYREALEILEQLAPASLAVAECLNDLGLLARQQGNFAKAEAYYRQALATREKLAPNSLDVAESLGNLGILAHARGYLSQAAAYLRRAMDIEDKLAPGSLASADTLFEFGSVAETRGDLRQGETYLRRALDIESQLAPGSAAQAESLHSLGVLLRRTNQVAAAAPVLSQALDSLENQTSKLGGTEENRARFRATYAAYYRDYLDLLLSLHRPEQAFQILERSRARSMLAMLAERDLLFSADLPPEVQKARKRNAEEYDRTQGQLAQLSPAKQTAKLESLQERLRELTREREALTERIRSTSPRLAALQYPQPLDLAGARQALDPGTLLLSYSVGPDSTFLFVVQPAGVDPGLQVLRIPVTETALRKQISEFRQLIQQRTSASLPALQSRGQALYDLLVKPAEAALTESKRLLIVPDGPIHTLPFNALRRGSEYLIEWKPVHIGVSATVYAQLRKTRRTPVSGQIELAAFGAPHYPATSPSDLIARGNTELRSAIDRGFDFSPLPFSRQEVQNIAALFPNRSQTFTDEEATEERAKRVGNQVRYLHFATHAVLDERFPLNSAVVLSIPEQVEEGHENGLLQAWEIFDQVRLDADLVVLSGCRTGLGQEVSGEGLIGLTRAFQYAGAHSVMASLWSVDDRRTAQLMKSFYEHLAAGKSKDRALQSAQLTLLRAGTPPFYWASFALNGDWR